MQCERRFFPCNLVYLCCTHLQKLNLEYKTFILARGEYERVTCLDKKAKRAFKTMLVDYGYSEKVADELCKWYAFSEKKGVASY
jgi:hypothetical protein